MKPYLKETGWVNHDKTRVKVWMPKDKDGKYLSGEKEKEFTLNSLVLEGSFLGFTENGVIKDIFCAISTVDFRELPIEDLMALDKWMTKNFQKETANDRAADLRERGGNGATPESVSEEETQLRKSCGTSNKRRMATAVK